MSSFIRSIELNKNLWKQGWKEFWNELDEVKTKLNKYRSVTDLPDGLTDEDIQALSNELSDFSLKLKMLNKKNQIGRFTMKFQFKLNFYDRYHKVIHNGKLTLNNECCFQDAINGAEEESRNIARYMVGNYAYFTLQNNDTNEINKFY